MKNKIKTINGGKENDYEKNYIKIKFNSDDDLPLNKPLKLHLITIVIRSFFEEDGKLYLKVFLDGMKMLEYDRIDISVEINVNKTSF